jgi:hypothetical protein
MAKRPIIPGVPTPRRGDPNCAISVCLAIFAQVECIIVIMQGTTACIDIQFFDKNGKPLDLSQYDEFRILLFDELECAIANFYYPDVPSGCKGFPIEILQYTTTDGKIHNEGLVRICLTKECTSLMSTGAIFAEMLLTYRDTAGTEEVQGISCLKVADVVPSRINNIDCDSGICG